jgi:hypothetical protein
VKKTLMTMAVLALGGLMSTQAATAAPFARAAGATQGVAISDVEHVRDQKRGVNKSYKNRRGYRNRGYNNWRSDRRYYRYRNYNRYYSRPYNWRSRGCVSVGPIWFCK